MAIYRLFFNSDLPDSKEWPWGIHDGCNRFKVKSFKINTKIWTENRIPFQPRRHLDLSIPSFVAVCRAELAWSKDRTMVTFNPIRQDQSIPAPVADKLLFFYNKNHWNKKNFPWVIHADGKRHIFKFVDIRVQGQSTMNDSVYPGCVIRLYGKLYQQGHIAKILPE